MEEAREKKLAGSTRWNNRYRARYGHRAVRAGSPDYHQNDAHENLVDALANMRHYAEANGLDFYRAARSARAHFEAEIAGEE